MKFNSLIALACLTTSFAALAQMRDDRRDPRRDPRNGVNLTDPASVLLDRFGDTYDQLRRNARFLDGQSIADLNVKVDEINRILFSRNQPSQADLRCVSKDNDGQNPYMIGVAVDPVTVVKIPGTVSTNVQACQGLIASIRMQFDGGLMCVSKDNDGQNPYVIASLSISARSLSVVPSSVSTTLASCNQMISDIRSSASGNYFCGSKDNDGQNPWVKVLLRGDGSVVKGAETYSSYQLCNSAP